MNFFFNKIIFVFFLKIINEFNFNLHKKKKKIIIIIILGWDGKLDPSETLDTAKFRKKTEKDP